ncbi:putative calcium ion binding protein [Plectosphaerella cucumerina]|uniref:Calcium ion binding protein n=1 Tax=Plectosphaerella cucumerina TaxID=40658 RepID=A0A8K0TB12_9PEZI|nr:putative calcium ion binding protein [Plectosphaerella cucumerina]
MQRLIAVGLVFAGAAVAHGDHSGQAPIVADDANWMTKHMAEEHHMNDWDAASFFGLHDYNSDGQWGLDEIMRTYGLMDESNKNMAWGDKERIGREVLSLMDTSGDRTVSREEWQAFIDAGNTLPDKGTGPGHHGDDEYEYEIHHWEKYHDENTKLEDLTHPEDIEHFKKHEEMEDEEDRLERLDRMPIVEANIPEKFRRQ